MINRDKGEIIDINNGKVVERFGQSIKNSVNGNQNNVGMGASDHHQMQMSEKSKGIGNSRKINNNDGSQFSGKNSIKSKRNYSLSQNQNRNQ